jgi:hypothetical protein
MCRNGPLLMLLTIVLAACARTPDEQRLRATVVAMEAALETGRPSDFIEHVGKDFIGQDGMDQRQLRGMLLAHTVRHEQVSILLGPLDVQMFGDRATVRVRVIATGGRLLPETGRQLDVESHWRFEDGEWMCFRADWR